MGCFSFVVGEFTRGKLEGNALMDRRKYAPALFYIHFFLLPCINQQVVSVSNLRKNIFLV